VKVASFSEDRWVAGRVVEGIGVSLGIAPVALEVIPSALSALVNPTAVVALKAL
jgi:hypothetical protein